MFAGDVRLNLDPLQQYLPRTIWIHIICLLYSFTYSTYMCYPGSSAIQPAIEIDPLSSIIIGSLWIDRFAFGWPGPQVQG